MGGETTRVENRGETTRGETTRGETSWGRNVLLPLFVGVSTQLQSSGLVAHDSSLVPGVSLCTKSRRLAQP